ncbi:MAG: exodeoxyribonuclease VII small subunit [Lactobacillales bacterium]|jgi:exodeoxyribonuclease VII small subunit|nr:exodeoxyribonuclease VII small subunit [Lactobacillales bacterium]
MSKSFEEVIVELEAITKELNNSELPLEKAIEKYKAGVELSAQANEKLTQAQEVIAKLVEADGQASDFDA